MEWNGIVWKKMKWNGIVEKMKNGNGMEWEKLVSQTRGKYNTFVNICKILFSTSKNNGYFLKCYKISYKYLQMCYILCDTFLLYNS